MPLFRAREQVYLGTVGARPSVSKPSEDTTGIRQPTTQTLTAGAALTAVLAAPVEGDGRRYLRRTFVTGQFTLNLATHTDLVFEDCVFENGGTYTVSSFYNVAAVPSSAYPEFRYCEMRGVSGSDYPGTVFIGSYTRLLRCHVHHGIDIVKLWSGVEVYACLLDDGIKSGLSHSDTIQVQQGSNMLVHWNNVTGRCADDSPDRPGGLMDRALQTGGLIGDVINLRYEDNWFDGGNDYALGIGSTGGPPDVSEEGYLLDHSFRRNKFGRAATTGPVSGTRTTTSTHPDGLGRWTADNVYEDTGLPV